MPGKFSLRVRVFPFQGIGKVDRAIAHGEIQFMPGFDLLEVETQGFEQDIWEHGHTVILPFSIADQDLTVGKVIVLHSQAYDFI